MIRIFLIAILTMVSINSYSQTKKERWRLKSMLFHQKADSILDERYNRVNYDTTFIGRPRAGITTKLRFNMSGNNIKADGKNNGVKYNTNLSTDEKTTMSIGVNYRGIAAGVALNPAKLKGKNIDYEFNFNTYSNRLSLDASYQSSKTLSGDFMFGDNEAYLERGTIDMRVLNVAGYYTFNYRRFSFPAAFTQSYIQKRSAGSWLAGFCYQGGVMKSPGDESQGIPSLRMFVGHFAIGAGYGYNLVVGKRWLFHLSSLPTFIILNRNNIKTNDEKRKIGYHFPEMLFNERIAVVYNISDRYFLAATGVINHSLYRSDKAFVRQNKWRTRACFGIRF